MSFSGDILLQHSQFLSNFVGSFKELRTDEELFDVTLACEDETVEAHKVVLSASSPFFRKVLSKTKQDHPFIYLKGVLHQDLLALLDYIYIGETEVPADDINRFIEAARELKIKGLAEEEINNGDKTCGEIIQISCESDLRDMKKEVHEDEKEEEEEVSKDIFSNKSDYKVQGVKNLDEKEQDGKLRLEILKLMEKISEPTIGKMWKCKKCGKIVKRKFKLERHVETHLKTQGFVHACLHCDKSHKTRGSLERHIFTAHKGVK